MVLLIVIDCRLHFVYNDVEFICILLYLCALFAFSDVHCVYRYCRRQPDGKPGVKPEFKNAKVASLYDNWQRVVQLSAERHRRLQQMLDRLNEVSHCLVCHIINCLNIILSVISFNIWAFFCLLVLLVLVTSISLLQLCCNINTSVVGILIMWPYH